MRVLLGLLFACMVGVPACGRDAPEAALPVGDGAGLEEGRTPQVGGETAAARPPSTAGAGVDSTAEDSGVPGGTPAQGAPGGAPVVAAAALVSVRDSAGVRVVESRAPAWTAATRWTVDPTPILEIGVADGEAPYLFSELYGGLLHPDGSVVLLDGRSMEIRVFAPDGTHRATFGGIGAGPGQFIRSAYPLSMHLALAAPDTLLVWHPGNLQLSWFSLDGTRARGLSVGREVQGLSDVSRGFDLWQVLSDGTILWGRDMRRETPDRLYNRPYALMGPTEPGVVRVVDFPGSARLSFRSGTTAGGNAINMNVSQDLFPAGGVARARAEPFGLFVPDAERWEIRVHGRDGRVEQVFRLALARRPVSDAMIGVERERFEGYGEAGMDAFRRLHVADSLPAIDSYDLRWDDDGFLWVRHYATRDEPPRPFEVLDREGRWLGRVEAPTVSEGRLRILAIEHGRLLAVHRDELGVERARVYRIRRPGG